MSSSLSLKPSSSRASLTDVNGSISSSNSLAMVSEQVATCSGNWLSHLDFGDKRWWTDRGRS